MLMLRYLLNKLSTLLQSPVCLTLSIIIIFILLSGDLSENKHIHAHICVHTLRYDSIYMNTGTHRHYFTKGMFSV